jgi:nicotinamidase-related amidase
MKVHLVVIDPQNDFCDPNGSLFVPGADQDMSRLSTLVNRIHSRLDDISVTLDSHHRYDVAHPVFWKDRSGNHPGPFTLISSSDVENQVWTPSQPGHYKRALEYVKQLERNDRYTLCIWPPHCLIGHWGHNVYPELHTALENFENSGAIVNYVTKGSNIWTEHYSAIQAEVVDPNDPTTQLNDRFINALAHADIVAIAGEASSHCLASTARDIADNLGDDFVSKIVLLEDATSPVPGFESLGTSFVDDLTARGMQISNTVDFLA